MDFAHWWSFIRKGLCLQPAQQACFYVSSLLYYLYFLHCFSSMNQGLKIVVYVRRQTANIHIFQCYLPSYIPNLYTTVENGKYPFNKVNIKFCIFDPLWLSGLYVSLKQQPFKGGDLKCKKNIWRLFITHSRIWAWTRNSNSGISWRLEIQLPGHIFTPGEGSAIHRDTQSSFYPCHHIFGSNTPGGPGRPD